MPVALKLPSLVTAEMRNKLAEGSTDAMETLQLLEFGNSIKMSVEKLLEDFEYLTYQEDVVDVFENLEPLTLLAQDIH